MGVVIDAEKGLVVISRAIVPYDLCDIYITIADSIIVEGKVVFMHPLQNYAIVRYDPCDIEHRAHHTGRVNILRWLRPGYADPQSEDYC